MSKIESELLGDFVQRYALQTVLEALARHCSAEAMHAAVNAQNVPLAKRWDRAASLLEQVAINRSVIEVS